jgi:pimeloyl-ACP methyl ester carboxylesterase
MDTVRLLKRIKRIWVTVGLAAFVVFTGWSVIAYRATSEAHEATRSDSRVAVTYEKGVWTFTPTASRVAAAGLLFFPGALVDPVAYAPLARAVAEAGYPVRLVELPRRGAFGGADDPELFSNVNGLIDRSEALSVLAGHSRGAVVATQLAGRHIRKVAGLILIGTSHPRDVDLSALTIPVTKIIGTRDGLASIEEVEENKNKLPLTTRWVRIEGGNHSQFGWYGFQPGDSWPGVSAQIQRTEMLKAIIDTLTGIAGGN